MYCVPSLPFCTLTPLSSYLCFTPAQPPAIYRRSWLQQLRVGLAQFIAGILRNYYFARQLVLQLTSLWNRDEYSKN